MFGGGRKASGPRKGKAKLLEVQVTLEEIFSGVMKNIKITRQSLYNVEPEFVSHAREKEEKMLQNAPSVKAQAL